MECFNRKVLNNFMSKKSIIIGLFFVALAGVLLWFASRSKEAVSTQPGQGKTISLSKEEKREAAKRMEKAKEEQRRAREEMKNEWKTPIRFYGKVVDENGEPVAGAKAHFSWTDLSPEGTSQADVYSNAQGLFSLSGVNGKFTTVDVEKEGYYTSRQKNRSSFEYAEKTDESFYKPDPSSPVIFHLQKKGEAEGMIQRQTLFGFKPDGSPGYLDLMDGKNRKDRSGDIVVRLTRGPEDEQRHFDCTIVFEALSGGLVESEDEFMFLAPETGYQPALQFHWNKDDPKWQMNLKKKFYIKSREGKIFARVEADIISRYNDQAAINMTYYVNPSGSRNLEYDPAKQINK